MFASGRTDRAAERLPRRDELRHVEIVGRAVARVLAPGRSGRSAVAARWSWPDRALVPRGRSRPPSAGGWSGHRRAGARRWTRSASPISRRLETSSSPSLRASLAVRRASDMSWRARSSASLRAPAASARAASSRAAADFLASASSSRASVRAGGTLLLGPGAQALGVLLGARRGSRGPGCRPRVRSRSASARAVSSAPAASVARVGQDLGRLALGRVDAIGGRAIALGDARAHARLGV